MIQKNHYYFNWLHSKRRYYHLFNLGTGLFVWLFLLITLPFGIYENNLGGLVNLALFLLPAGVIWASVYYLVDLNSRLRKTLFGWCLKILIIVQLIFVFRGLLCDWTCTDAMEYLQLLLAGFILFVLTYIPYSFYARYLYFHSLVSQPDTDSGIIRLRGEGKEYHDLVPAIMVYLKAADNYVEIHCMASSIEKKLLRATLKSVEEQLVEFPQFVRIHRSVIVNIRFVDSEGISTRQIKVKAGDSNLLFPISESYRPRVKELLIHPK